MQTCGSASSAAPQRASIPSATVAGKLAQGDPFDREGVTLLGDLVLKPERGLTVSAPFRCRACRIEGSLSADDVNFAGTVDLSGTTIAGAVRLARARFGGPVLFEPVGDRPTVFADTTDFTRAGFGDDASFTGAVFSGPATFGSARFLGDVSFADSCFLAPTDFAATVFEGPASFRSSARQAFDRSADFTSARFAERADFRRRVFRGATDFSQAEFRAVADLSRTDFSSEASFLEARFADRSTFFAAVFRNDVIFDDAVATASFDLTNGRFLQTASFLSFESTGVTALDGSNLQRLAVNDNTRMSALRIAGFDGVVAALDRYEAPDSVEHFLGVVESAAKARGDLKLANDARYARRKRQAERYGRLRRLADDVFYRGVSGYLVRPWHPLVTLALVAFTVAVARRYHAERVLGRLRGGRLPRHLHPARRGGAELFGLAGDTLGRLALVAPGHSSARDDGAVARPWLTRLEVWVYRALFAVFAITLANSNPTLRQMLDAVF